jgi:hypothetical protein
VHLANAQNPECRLHKQQPSHRDNDIHHCHVFIAPVPLITAPILPGLTYAFCFKPSLSLELPYFTMNYTKSSFPEERSALNPAFADMLSLVILSICTFQCRCDN